MNDRMDGTVTRVFLPRGFAFIRGTDGQDYFFQADQLLPPAQWDGVTIHEYATVSFAPRKDGRGRNGLRATMVELT